jgi:hypothetical protein
MYAPELVTYHSRWYKTNYHAIVQQNERKILFSPSAGKIAFLLSVCNSTVLLQPEKFMINFLFAVLGPGRLCALTSRVGLLPSEGVLTHPQCQQPTRTSIKAGSTVGTRISRKAEEGYLHADRRYFSINNKRNAKADSSTYLLHGTGRTVSYDLILCIVWYLRVPVFKIRNVRGLFCTVVQIVTVERTYSRSSTKVRINCISFAQRNKTGTERRKKT